MKINVSINFNTLGFTNTDKNNALTFLDDQRYSKELLANKNISGVFVSEKLSDKINTKNIFKIVVDDPRFSFFTLYNFLGEKNYKRRNSIIHSSSKIHNSANISDYNVKIGNNADIGANVSILPDVEIGDNCLIKEGAVLGCEGYELKRTIYGVLSVFHDGKLIIGNNVQIGSNSTVYKGFSYRDTIIGDGTKIDNLVYIAHGAWIGKECFLVGNSMISGSTEVGDRVWVGPGVTVSNLLKIGDDAYLSIGSVVTKDVEKNQRVTGNFATPHDIFLKKLKQFL